MASKFHMKIEIKKPPVWDDCLKAFPVIANLPVVFAYGDIIYNPTNCDIPNDVIVHEKVHAEQQRNDPEGPIGWWREYIADPQFRYIQELEAYRAQYAYLKDVVRDRNLLHRHLHKIASDLSGEMYGSIVTLSEAMQAIKNNQ